MLLGLLAGGAYWWQREAGSSLPGGSSWANPLAALVEARSPATASSFSKKAPGPAETTRLTVPRFWEHPVQALEVSIRGEFIPDEVREPPFQNRPPVNDFEVQVALVRNGCSPGSIDGMNGPQTRAAIRAFQIKHRLAVTGSVDAETRARLTLDRAPTMPFVVTNDDLARLRPLSTTWLGKSQQDKLEYESILELAAEKGMAHPNLLRNLNPNLDWSYVPAGTTLTIPFVYHPPLQSRAAFLRIYLGDRALRVFDIRTNLLAHFPCSIGRVAEKRPVGRLQVAVIAENPNYTFNPEIFTESAEAQTLGRKLIVPPGPNNPVGLAWIGLDRPGYGIHGTPIPEKVGRTESHGCFRLANWNAAYLLKMAWLTMPVYIEP